MARITMLSPDQLDPELRRRSKADERTSVELGTTRILGHQPEMANGLHAFTSSLKAIRTLSDRLIELVRLRVAFHNQCRSCMAIRYPDALDDGLTEDLVCSLERPMESDDLDERERWRSDTASCSQPTISPSMTPSTNACENCSPSPRSSSSG